MTDVSKVALRLYRQSMHESLSTMHAYANVHREVWSSRLGTHMESHYRTTTTIGVSSLDVYSNAPPWIEPDPNHTTLLMEILVRTCLTMHALPVLITASAKTALPPMERAPCSLHYCRTAVRNMRSHPIGSPPHASSVGSS